MHDLADEFPALAAGFFEVADALGQAGDRLLRRIDFHGEKRLELGARLRPSEELVVGRVQPEQFKDWFGSGQAYAARGSKAGQRLGDGACRDFPVRHTGRQRLGELHVDLAVKIILLQVRGDADRVRPVGQPVADDFGQRTGVHRDAQVVLLVGREGAAGVGNLLSRFFQIVERPLPRAEQQPAVGVAKAKGVSVVEVHAPAGETGHGLLKRLAAAPLGQLPKALDPKHAAFFVQRRDERDVRSAPGRRDIEEQLTAPEVGQQLSQGRLALGVVAAHPLGQFVEYLVAERLGLLECPNRAQRLGVVALDQVVDASEMRFQHWLGLRANQAKRRDGGCQECVYCSLHGGHSLPENAG